MHGEDGSLDELDLALVNALQFAPRAPWAQLAGPLDVDPATLSRRWARLRDSGTSWITCYSAPSQVDYGAFALIEVDCEPTALDRLAERIARHPHALSVEITAGTCALLLTVATDHLKTMGEYVQSLGALPGITHTRTNLVQRIEREGSQWRLDSLSRQQQRGLVDPGARPDHEPAVITDAEQRLILALARDGRRSYASLAAELGCTEQTARRMVSTLIGSGKAVLRCEAAHVPAGWRAATTLWLSVPPAQLDRAAQELAAERETRMSAVASSDANLLACALVHRLSDLSRFEARFAARFPDVRVLRRVVTLRWIKRTGRLLDADGRAVGHVPMNVWSPPGGDFGR